MTMTFGIFCPIHSGGFVRRESSDERVDTTWESAKALTLQAEALGFEYNLVATRWFGPVLEPFTTTAAMAAVTSRIRIMLAVQAGLIQPQVVAKMGANIDQISGGRFNINLVSGSDAQQFQITMYGGDDYPHDERYSVSDEFIQVVKGIWRNQPYSFDGRYFHVDAVDCQPKPIQESPAIFLGGSSEPAKDLAAKECDWFFVQGATPEEALDMKADVARRAREQGRTLRFAIAGMLMVRDSNAEAEREIAQLEERAKDDRTVRIHAAGLRSGLWGTPDRIAERLAEISSQGFEMTLFQSKSFESDLARFGEQIVPLLPLAEGHRDYLTVR